MRELTTALIAIAAGFSGAALWDFAGLGPDRTRETLMANPEILPEAMQELNRRDMMARIEPLRDELEMAFPGAVLGNPNGTVTLVEFTDYACSYCRLSLDHVNTLIAENPDLRVVIREYPILTNESADAARMALAAAEQGKFEAFHNAMFQLDGPSPENIERAARIAGLDLERARTGIEGGLYETQLQNNVFMGQNMRLSGTPAWIVGDQVLSGAVGEEALSAAIAEARDS